MNVLEERNQGNKLLVVAVTLPGVEDDGVLRLLPNMSGVGVDNDDLGQIAVEVGKVLYE